MTGAELDELIRDRAKAKLAELQREGLLPERPNRLVLASIAATLLATGEEEL
jgi:hypothetical protein